MFLEISQNSQENTCARVSCNFIKKETLAKVFSCESCEIPKNNLFYRTPLVAASEMSQSSCSCRGLFRILPNYCTLHKICQSTGFSPTHISHILCSGNGAFLQKHYVKYVRIRVSFPCVMSRILSAYAPFPRSRRDLVSGVKP